MRPSLEEMGIDGAPLVFPLGWRRALARLVSYHPWLLGLTIWLLHQLWGWGGLFHPHQLARDWCRAARQLSLAQALRLGRSMAALDRHPTFAKGAREHARNCSESMFRRSGFLDYFFEREPLPVSATSHPAQRPYYLVPGLPARPFYDREEFAWARALEESFPIVLAELEAILSDGRGFGSYQTEFETTIKGWNTYALWLHGQRHQENAARCPGTIALLESLPGFETGEWILFSALNGHSRIPPHVGPINGILRAHLALKVPPGCGLRVGGVEATWKAGEVLVFDDSFVHDVWNSSQQLRVVLFLNFWHPGLSEPERQALAELRQAYNDTPTGKRWHDRQEKPLPHSLRDD